MTERGLFVTFEGGDGSGKTTQLRLAADRLRATGRDVVTTVEPGWTAIGQQIRAILLDRANMAMAPRTELLLYFAARAQNVHEVIGPGLERGAVVLSDRYTDSTLAYQGGGRELGSDVVRCIHDIACGGLWPRLTLVFDVPPEVGLARRRAEGGVDRLDAETVEFHRRVRDAYLELSRREPERVRVIDATGSVEEVAARTWEVLSPYV